MTTAHTYPTEYFLQEGKENLVRCLQATFEAAAAHNIGKVIIFTSAGLGVRMALENYLCHEKYAHIKLVAVTFPSQTEFSSGDPSEYSISEATAEYMAHKNIPIVRAHLPFDPIRAHHEGHGILGQDFSLIGNALRIFCGSMSLCVQAVLMASDAGQVGFGEHVIAMTSDTSILARAAGTSRFLTDLIVRQIICKPVLLTVGKSETVEQTFATINDEELPQLDLPANTEEGD